MKYNLQDIVYINNKIGMVVAKTDNPTISIAQLEPNCCEKCGHLSKAPIRSFVEDSQYLKDSIKKIIQS